jgi:hypothetical protein
MLTCGLVRSNFAFATGGLLLVVNFSAVLTAGWWDLLGGYSPVALAMISLATLVGTSA